MIIYILRDDNPRGGYFAASEFKPDMRYDRAHSISEVREVEVNEDVWHFVLAGGLPVDSDGSNDSTWIEYWPDGRTVWLR